MKSKRRRTLLRQISQVERLEMRTVLTGPTITSSALVSIPENQVAVTVITATDPDAPNEQLVYAIAGGTDAALFSLDPLTGSLSFISAPDFEMPLDANADENYDLTVSVDDGIGGTVTQDMVVTVTGINDAAPVFSSSNLFNVAKNSTEVGTVLVTDADLPAQTISYSITGGADAALFGISSATGELFFTTAPDFEAPADADANNIYELLVTADDGNGKTSTQSVAVTVTAVNDNAPIFSSLAAFTIAENTTSVGTVAATDADLPAQAVTYGIANSPDAALFSIDPNTGALAFLAAPNFESPSDVGADNIYNISVTASDGDGQSTVQNVAVTVTGVNEFPPVITSPNALTVPATTTAVATVTATDEDLPAQSLTYSISGGVDAAFFQIDSATGALTFVTAPDFLSPLDAGADNVYNVTVTVADNGGLTATQSIAVTVTKPPLVFSSPSVFTVDENTTSVGTLVAADPDLAAPAVVYQIAGGADAALFTIDPNTGVLAFQNAPDFELPADNGADNIYNVTVTATDGDGSPGIQNLTVTVAAVNDNTPVFTSPTTFSVAENTASVGSVIATDADLPAQSLEYSITGGDDQNRFTIDSATGALVFVTAPDFESPLDADGNNVYDLEVTVSDGNGLSAKQNVSVTVTNLPISITSPATFTVNENTSQVGTVAATDADISAPAMSYRISGGADAALFAIDSGTGALSFVTAPDFESPLDGDADNVYDIIVTASNGDGIPATQDITVTVANLPLAFTSPTAYTVTENTTDVGTISATDTDSDSPPVVYSITGGADAGLFSIDPNTGALAFLSAPDFDSPTDSDADNIYNVTVGASNGDAAPSTQNIAVTVTGLNDNVPVFTTPATFNVPENTSAVGSVAATDADLPAQTLTYSITDGADASLFSIDPSTGALAFLAAPDFESPLDSDTDNVYQLVVTASDGNGSMTTQNISVTVTPVDEQAPAFTTPAEFTVTENLTDVGSVLATDDDLPAQSLTFSITGGSDASLFQIDPTTGKLSFLAAPDFEHPGDSDGDNVYNISVTANDNAGLTTVQNITVTVTNDVEAPVITLDEADKVYYVQDKDKLIAPMASFSADSSEENFAGATLVVDITNNRHAGDQLTFNSDAGKFKVHGDEIYFHGQVIGEIKGGKTAGSQLKITFNSLVFARTIDLLMKQLSFTFTSKASVGQTRTISTTLINADGTQSNQASRDITVDAKR